MSHEQKQYEEENRERGRILARYFKVDSLKDDNSHLVRRYLWAAVAAAIVMPLLFYWQFGKVSWFAIGFTVFWWCCVCWWRWGFTFKTGPPFTRRCLLGITWPTESEPFG